MARVGLVLGAGGVVGHAWHVGVLSALSDVLGWDARDAEVIVGTSAGSHVGAHLRAGLSPTDAQARLLGRPLSDEGARLMARVGPPVPVPAPRTRTLGMTAPRLVARGALFPFGRRPAAILAGALPEGRVPLDAFATRIRWLFGSSWPREALWLPAVALRDGRRVVFGRAPTGGRQGAAPQTDVGTAVAASCAVPGWFSPVVVDGERFVDGGVHSPTNVELLAGEDLDLVVVSSPMSVAAGHWTPRAAVGLRASLSALLAVECWRVRRAGTPVVTFEPSRSDVQAMGINGMDPARRVDTVVQAYATTVRRLRSEAMRERLALLAPQGARPDVLSDWPARQP